MERILRQELDDKLVERHPAIFNVGSRTYCDDGWFAIIDTLCDAIQGHISWSERRLLNDIQHNRMVDEDPNYRTWDGSPQTKVPVREPVNQVTVTYIKEKFGQLRFHYVGGDDTIRGMVDMAEMFSTRTCEKCGDPGVIRGGSWIKTLCDQHHVARSLEAHDDFLP